MSARRGSPGWHGVLLAQASKSDVVTRRRMRVLAVLAAFAKSLGLPIEALGRDMLDGWIAGQSNRCLAACVVRRAYRTAWEMGVISEDPAAGIHCRSGLAPNEVRLSNLELRATIAAIRKDLVRSPWDLNARRDIALFAVAMCHEWKPGDLAALEQGAFDSEASTLDSMGESVPLSARTTDALLAFRERLLGDGVEVVADDPLLPGLHMATRWALRATQRDLLPPLSKEAVMFAVGRRLKRAGVTANSGGRPFSIVRLIWLARDRLEDVDACLDGGIARRRIANVPMATRPVPARQISSRMS